jgi:hypothetical protein
MDYEQELQVIFWKGAITGYLFGIFMLLAIHKGFS